MKIKDHGGTEYELVQYRLKDDGKYAVHTNHKHEYFVIRLRDDRTMWVSEESLLVTTNITKEQLQTVPFYKD